ncbi:nucleotidyltransferase family protein [Piscinibacter sakaiensis]|uniref:nucleotidyltransferase family protein n=1 Tax=Piscinibacter sakaiensis TaxID=1547922 RepID=UPI003AADFA08
MQARPAVIVLAAGAGARFDGAGGHKLAQELLDASVLGTTLRHAVASHLPVVVVTTPALADLACRHVASRDVVVLPAVDSGSAEPVGMGYSIAAGVAARAHAGGWLILPGDMPLVQPSTLIKVAAALVDHPVAHAQHRGRRGHPVGFAAELYSELVVLSGDDGARRLLSRYPVAQVEVDDPGVLLDVDTEADLERLRAVAAEGQQDPEATLSPRN